MKLYESNGYADIPAKRQFSAAKESNFNGTSTKPFYTFMNTYETDLISTSIIFTSYAESSGVKTTFENLNQSYTRLVKRSVVTFVRSECIYRSIASRHSDYGTTDHMKA